MNGLEGSETALADQGLGGGFAQATNIFEAEAEGEFRGAFCRYFLSPLRGSLFFFCWTVPTACAVGFILSPLRG